MKYKLITFYASGRLNGTQYLLYGHESPGRNDLLGGFSTRQDAIAFAFTYGVPVMETVHADGIIEKLCSEPEPQSESDSRDWLKNLVHELSRLGREFGDECKAVSVELQKADVIGFKLVVRMAFDSGYSFWLEETLIDFTRQKLYSLDEIVMRARAAYEAEKSLARRGLSQVWPFSKRKD